MNWISECHRSWEWLQWMREVVGEPVEPAGCLPQLIRGLGEWDAAVAGDRHGTGDPGRIDSSECFSYAVSMMSRAAKDAIEDALRQARGWCVDDPSSWPSLSMPEATRRWEASHHVVKTVLQAWITL